MLGNTAVAGGRLTTSTTRTDMLSIVQAPCFTIEKGPGEDAGVLGFSYPMRRRGVGDEASLLCAKSLFARILSGLFSFFQQLQRAREAGKNTPKKIESETSTAQQQLYSPQRKGRRLGKQEKDSRGKGSRRKYAYPPIS